MINPALADKIAKVLLDQNSTQPLHAGHLGKVGFSNTIINDTCLEMGEAKPEWFKVHKPSAGGTQHISLRDGYQDAIRSFLNEGGFVRMMELQQAEEREERAVKNLQVENLKLVNKQIRKAMHDAKEAKWIARGALAASIIAIAVTVWLQKCGD